MFERLHKGQKSLVVPVIRTTQRIFFSSQLVTEEFFSLYPIGIIGAPGLAIDKSDLGIGLDRCKGLMTLSGSLDLFSE